MKIYIIKTEEKFRPKRQAFKYPAHNKDYGVEQDFLSYLDKNKQLLTENPQEATWHYLPIFWTRWHLNHNYGKEGLKELEKECREKIIDYKKTFCVCQYDDGPLVNLKDAKLFLASRKDNNGLDIPLLSSTHRLPFFKRGKKFLGSFIGRTSTHEIREELKKKFSDNRDFLIADGNFGSRYFVKNTLRSFISFCPRGYGGSSFRFFESIQLGVVPFLIGDLDTRPFKEQIDWEKISFYTADTKDVDRIITSKTKEELIKMGEQAKKIYEEKISYQKWCKCLITKLESIRNE